MKVIDIKIFSYIKSFFSFFIGLVLGLFRKKAKVKSGHEEHKPISIHIDNGRGPGDMNYVSQGSTNNYASRYSKKNENNDALVAWTEWNDTTEGNPNEDVEPENTELFKDMEPVISRPKVVRLKQKNADGVSSKGRINNKFGIEGDGFQIETELGTWQDEPSGWDDEDIDETEISRETARLMKEKKRAEREQRAMDQLRKKEEREAMRNQKKITGQLGVKLN